MLVYSLLYPASGFFRFCILIKLLECRIDLYTLLSQKLKHCRYITKCVPTHNSQNEVDSDPKVEEALFVESVEILMVNVANVLNTKADDANVLDYNEKLKVVHSRAEEDFIDFLNKWKLKDSEVMLCPYCRSVFDKQAAKEVEKTRPQTYQP